MKAVIISVLILILPSFRSRISMKMEIVALRHQLLVYQRKDNGPQIRQVDRIFWSFLSKLWPTWRDALYLVKPATVIVWRRKRFKQYWARLCRKNKPGRPPVDPKIIKLIRDISKANPLWGSPHIKGELQKIGIYLAKSTIEKYMTKRRKPPSQTWRAFLDNHLKNLISIDSFVVPTVKNTVLYVFLVLAHDRRRVVHFNVTERSTAKWAAQQIADAFPWDTAPKYLLRDRDRTYGQHFQKRVKNMGITEVMTAPRSPWQNPYVERLIGSIRRECMDYLIILVDFIITMNGGRRPDSVYLAGNTDWSGPWATERRPCGMPMKLLSTASNVARSASGNPESCSKMRFMLCKDRTRGFIC